MKIFYYLIIALFTCSSCFEKDEMVDPHETGGLTVDSVGLTENYIYQVFYDLETDSSVSQNLVSAWDLGFECSDSGWHVILNTSKMMLAGNTRSTDFNAVTGKETVDMYFDPSDKGIDSTAIGEWYSLNSGEAVSDLYTYIIDRGIDENDNSLGRKKVVFDISEDGSFIIRFADLDGSNEKTELIEKDNSRNFVCYSFDNGIVPIEPEKNSWDMVFTKYSTMLYSDGDPYPYLVVGVLLNPFGITANMDTLVTFAGINLTHAQEYPLFSRKDIIGYEWKTYDFDNEYYSVDPDKIYLIKDVEGYFYKLRFIDFYNSTGQKGFPTFEFVQL